MTQAHKPSLPGGWSREKIGQLAQIVRGVSFPKTAKVNSARGGYIPCLRTANVQQQVDWNDLWYIPQEYVKRDEQWLRQLDILISTANSLELVGKAAQVKQLAFSATLGAFISLIRAAPGLNRRYLYFHLCSPETRSQMRRQASTTTNISNISTRKLADIDLAVAPAAEQQRIVAKIEELFSQLDAGVAALEKAKAQLQRYRQAVLKAAMSGELTREWREAHKHELEPASALLEHILQERRARWEAQQLEKMKAKGGVPRHDKWKEKYKEPWRPPAHELPPVAAGWTWTSFQELAQATPHALKAGPFGSSLKKEYYVPSGYKIYGQEQVIRGDPFYGDYYVDEDRYRRLRPCAVKPGDVLVSLVGTIGKVLILPDDIQPGIINPRLVKLTLDKRIVRPRYVEAYLQSASVRQYFSLSSHGGTMDILNLTILKALPVALPPLEEQDAILGEVDRRMSIADQMDAGVEDDLVRSARLRQSILKRAFEGNLVPQDPTDEPASLLLERIKAEKAERETQAKRKRRRPKKNEPDQPTLFWKKDLHAQRAQPTRHHTQSTMHPG